MRRFWVSSILGMLKIGLLLSLCCTAVASEIYKWVDEKGNTHFGASVPAKYQSKAKPIDVKRTNVIENNQRDKNKAAFEKNRKAKGEASAGGSAAMLNAHRTKNASTDSKKTGSADEDELRRSAAHENAIRIMKDRNVRSKN